MGGVAVRVVADDVTREPVEWREWGRGKEEVAALGRSAALCGLMESRGWPYDVTWGHGVSTCVSKLGGTRLRKVATAAVRCLSMVARMMLLVMVLIMMALTMLMMVLMLIVGITLNDWNSADVAGDGDGDDDTIANSRDDDDDYDYDWDTVGDGEEDDEVLLTAGQYCMALSLQLAIHCSRVVHLPPRALLSWQSVRPCSVGTDRVITCGQSLVSLF